MHGLETSRRRAFSVWLRTGRRVAEPDDAIECKFNPWHDPRDGRFTFAGAGSTARASGGRSGGGARRVADFARGVGAAAYDTGKEAVAGLTALATTNPVTTVRNVGRGIAGTIDRAIAAEDVPASVQIGRAASAVANASAYDVGYGVGKAGIGVGLAIAPEALAAKLSAARSVGELEAVTTAPAQFGTATSRNYRATFFKAYPGTKGSVVVHHAVEVRVLTKYPGVVSESEIHSLENLRGIPKKLNTDLHLKTIRSEWDSFYREFDRKNLMPTKKQLLDKATEIDRKLGHQFRPAR